MAVTRRPRRPAGRSSRRAQRRGPPRSCEAAASAYARRHRQDEEGLIQLGVWNDSAPRPETSGAQSLRPKGAACAIAPAARWKDVSFAANRCRRAARGRQVLAPQRRAQGVPGWRTCAPGSCRPPSPAPPPLGEPLAAGAWDLQQRREAVAAGGEVREDRQALAAEDLRAPVQQWGEFLRRVRGDELHSARVTLRAHVAGDTGVGRLSAVPGRIQFKPGRQ